MFESEEILINHNCTTNFHSLLWESYSKYWMYFSSSFTSVLIMLDYQPWIMSLMGSALVGLSGILPLFFIPLDETATLKSGTGAKTLRILLSFAVGGLLGDVFLHLLPEAWENQYPKTIVTKERQQPSLTCGLWVLAGLLLFIIIEKMFSFEKKDETEADCDNIVNKSLGIRRKKSNFILNDLTINCVTDAKMSKTDHVEIVSNINNNLKNNINNNNNNVEKIAAPQIIKKPTVHVSGYLNLVANSIDNFTHGLAVGGSFLLSTRVGVFTTFAILVHEIPHEVGDFAILLKAGFSRWDAAWAQLCTAFAGILGALTALTFSVGAEFIETRTSWILPFTAGGFLHIALVTVLPELLDEKNPRESLKQMCSLASGITIMAVLTSLIEE